jgi:hypothetical protein
MAFATIGAARDAVMGWFTTEWTTVLDWSGLSVNPGTPPFVTYPDDLADTPQDNSSWVRLKWQTKLGYQATINSVGNRRFRTKGTLLVEVRTKLGGGLTDSDVIVNNVQAVFEGQTPGGEDTVIFREVTPVEHGPDGEWFLVNVLVNFEYDRLR